ncbi:MAG: MCP four helix bundle domain-containing protein, partial [Actinobacteria bacterium]|nr:MCP four helix bundle domain-containing protein [Actinomycetota bacterium]
MKFSLTSIRSKLFAGFGLTLALMLALGLFALTKLGTVEGGTASINNDIIPSISLIDNAWRNVEIMRQDQFRHIAASTAADHASVEHDMSVDVAAVATALKSYAPHTGTDTAARGRFNGVSRAWQTYLATSMKFLPFSRAGKDAPARRILNGTAQQFASMEGLFTD